MLISRTFEIFYKDLERYTKHIFEQIYNENRKEVIYFAQYYLNSKEEAEGVAQEVFIILWNKMEELNLEKDILPYLITLTRNKCLNILSSKKKQFIKYSSVQVEKNEINYISLDSADSSMIAAELNSILERTLEEMSPKVKKVFLLSRNENLKYSDIAKLEGVSVKTIEYRMMSALRVFRQNCKGFFNFKI